MLSLFSCYDSVCGATAGVFSFREVAATRQQNRTTSTQPSRKYIRKGPMAPARGSLDWLFYSCMAAYYTTPARAPQELRFQIQKYGSF